MGPDNSAAMMGMIVDALLIQSGAMTMDQAVDAAMERMKHPAPQPHWLSDRYRTRHGSYR